MILMHNLFQIQIPDISESTMQPSLVTHIIQDQSNVRELFSKKLKEIDAAISKFDFLVHKIMGESVPRNSTFQVTPRLLHPHVYSL